VFKKLHVLFLIFLALSMNGGAQELPPIVKFSPDNYGADNQNWMISQSNDSYIYVANNKGLLEYSGANWTLYPSPNESIIRLMIVFIPVATVILVIGKEIKWEHSTILP
jgi:AraC family chitin signaling transcriptional activator